MSKEADNTKRQHKATYATDKDNGGYLVRVIGPYANRFANRVIPVTRKDDTEESETLERLIWTGIDNDYTDPVTGVTKKGTGKPVALYSFKAHPRNERVVEVPF